MVHMVEAPCDSETSPEKEERLALLYEQSANFLSRVDPADAAKRYDKAIQIRHKLAKERPVDLTLLQALAGTYVDAAAIARSQGKFSEAERLLKEALDALQRGAGCWGGWNQPAASGH